MSRDCVTYGLVSLTAAFTSTGNGRLCHCPNCWQAQACSFEFSVYVARWTQILSILRDCKCLYKCSTALLYMLRVHILNVFMLYLYLYIEWMNIYVCFWPKLEYSHLSCPNTLLFLVWEKRYVFSLPLVYQLFHNKPKQFIIESVITHPPKIYSIN